MSRAKVESPEITLSYWINTSFKPAKKIYRFHCSRCGKAWGGYHTQAGARGRGERHLRTCEVER